MTQLTGHYDPMEESIKQRQELMERANRLFARTSAIERGRLLLGYILLSSSSRPNAPVAWKRRNQPALDNLPADLCQRALHAADAMDAATASMDAAERRFAAYVAQNQPSQELFNLKHEEMCIAERSAMQRADEALDNAAADLATAADDLQAIRRELVSIPARIKQRRADCIAAEQADIQTEKDLRARLARYALLD